MASGHVTALKGRTHGCTDQCCKRQESSCQLGAVHTWPLSDLLVETFDVCFVGRSGLNICTALSSASDPKRTSRPLRSAHDQRYISRRSSERPVLGLEARHQEALIRALLLARDRGGSAGRLSD